MPLLIDYFLRLTPGLVLIGITYSLIPKKMHMPKIMLLILGFILMRDTMTPMGFWNFGLSGNVLWLRFTNDVFLLLALAFSSLLLSIGFYYLDSSLAHYVKWFGDRGKMESLVVGTLASIIVVLPFIIPYFFVPIEQRGGTVPTESLIPLFLLALFGNLLEEVLFRGYLQGFFKEHADTTRSILLSGLFFAVGHIFLATTVTDLGLWVLIFTFYEGIICAFVHEKYGVISATLSHGLTIFILASGII